MTVKFSKNVFYSNEVVNADVHFNNSQSDVAVSSVVFKVVQDMRLRVQNHSKSETYVLSSSSKEVKMPARHPIAINVNMQINLDEVPSGNKVKETKKVGGQRIKRSNSELSLMKEIQPACHSGSEISNSYHLTVALVYDNWQDQCCVTGPEVSIPFSIIPVELNHMQQYGF